MKLKRACGAVLLLCAQLACHRVTIDPSPNTRPAANVPEPGSSRRVSLSDEWSSVVTIIRDDSIVLALPNGNKQVERRSRTARFTLTLTPGGNLSIHLDSLSYNPAIPVQEGSVGTVWNGRLDRTGRPTLSATRRNNMTEDLTRSLLDILPRMPRAGVTVGAAWADTAENSLRIDVYDTDEQRTSRWTAGEPRRSDQLVLMPVTSTENFEQLGKGTVAQRSTTMSAQGVRRGTWNLTLLGVVHDAMIRDSVSKLVTISGTRDPVPTMEISRITVRFSAVR